MEMEEDEEEHFTEEASVILDTSMNLASLTTSKKTLTKRAKVVQEVEPDQEMLDAEENFVTFTVCDRLINYKLKLKLH